MTNTKSALTNPSVDEIAATMQAALMKYWEEQGMSYNDSDLPSNMEFLQMAIAAKSALALPQRPDDEGMDIFDAVKQGVAEARTAFDANPADFNNSLDDDDYAAFIYPKIHAYLRAKPDATPSEMLVSDDHSNDVWKAPTLKTIGRFKQHEVITRRDWVGVLNMLETFLAKSDAMLTGADDELADTVAWRNGYECGLSEGRKAGAGKGVADADVERVAQAMFHYATDKMPAHVSDKFGWPFGTTPEAKEAWMGLAFTAIAALAQGKGAADCPECNGTGTIYHYEAGSKCAGHKCECGAQEKVSDE